MKTVSIIIPVHPRHNTEDALGACLESISKQTYPKELIELVLMGDDCDLTDIAGTFSDKNIKKIIHNFKEHTGPIKARNKAIELSTNDILVFLDSDCIVAEEWLSELLEGFTREDIGVSAGKLVDPDICINKIRIFDEVHTLPGFGLGNIAIRRSVLHEVGALDESLRIGNAEELDLAWRICLKGYHIEYREKAVAFHEGIPDEKEMFVYGRGIRVLAHKYSKVLADSFWRQIYRYMLILQYELKEKFSFFTIKRQLIVIAGYTCEALLGVLRLSVQVEPVDLTDRYLQPEKDVKPLAVAMEGSRLVKPNYILWWQTRRGCMVANLKTKTMTLLFGTAEDIWRHIVYGDNREDAINALLEEYEVKREELETDLQEFLVEAQEEGILRNYAR